MSQWFTDEQYEEFKKATEAVRLLSGVSVDELEDILSNILPISVDLSSVVENLSGYKFDASSNIIDLSDLELEFKNEKNPMRKKQLARDISKMRIKNKIMRG